MTGSQDTEILMLAPPQLVIISVSVQAVNGQMLELRSKKKYIYIKEDCTDETKTMISRLPWMTAVSNVKGAMTSPFSSSEVAGSNCN